MKIKELLSDETKWCKFESAKDKNGKAVGWSDNKACKWCLSGALYKCYYFDFLKIEEIQKKIYEKINISNISWNNIPIWNDYTKTTFKDVKKLVEELDI